MTITLHHPARLVDLMALSRRVSSIQWQVLRECWGRGFTWVWRDGDDPIALTMLDPLPRGGFEANFVFAAEAGPHMRRIVRDVRLTLENGPYSGTVTVCATDAGKRMAKLCGLHPEAQTSYGEVWVHGLRQQFAGTGPHQGAAASRFAGKHPATN